MTTTDFKAALRGHSALLAAGLLAASLGSTSALGQETTEPPVAREAAAEDDVEAGTIIVTGSRIARPNDDSTIPITSISGDDAFKSGDSNFAETLNELPQLRTTYAQQNPGLGIGVAGLNLLDLRGLGTARTLVLVNGRRHVAADILNTAASPDVNSIPNDLLERVDIVTGGNSAVYGSDAIAGVVNFILKRNFQGAQVRGHGSISPHGFGENLYLSGMYGTNFADDRGNVILHAEVSHQARVFGSELPWLRKVDGFAITDLDPASLANGSDGAPDATFIRDIRLASIHRFGLVPITQPPGAGALCGIGAGPTNGPTSPVGGVPFNCTYIFGRDGSLAAQSGTRFNAGILGGVAGGNGQTGREDQLLSIQPRLRRYNFNILANFEFSDAANIFLEAKWNRVQALGNNSSPSAIQGTFGQFDFRERARLDNPYLSPAQRTQIANLITASGCNTSLTAACVTAGGAFAARTATAGQGTGGALNAADLSAIAAGTYRFVVARTLADLGIRDEKFERDTFRIVLGVKGTFNDDWKYELSFNYGQFNQSVETNGFLDRQRLMLALDAGRNPVTGQIQCRAQFDPNSAVAFDTGAFQTGGAPRTSPSQPSRLAADIAACVPYNPFGATDNLASANYFRRPTKTRAELNQFVINAFVSGDTSGFLNLPGGPVRFVLGGEYRREKAYYFDDLFVMEGSGLLNTQSNTNNVVISNFLPPAFEVKEAFGELQFPILADTPFFHELTVSGAGRVAGYSGATGTVYAFNAGVDWAPVKDLRFRGNFGRSVRAPNLFETYFPLIPNFAPNFIDPCSPNALAANPNRPGNCLAAAGGNAAILANIPNVTQSLPVLSGSNPNLFAETSDSWTVGGVFQPSFIPGLAISADYYDITVKNVIVSLSAQTIANNCVDQPNLNNVFCGLFQRYLGPTPGPLGEVQGQVLGNTLLQAGVNFAARKRRGIDFNLAYRTSLSESVKIDTHVLWTHSLQVSNFENPALPDFENRILGELGDPKNEVRWDVDLTYNKVTLGYRLRYIGPMFTSAYENFRELPSACTAAGCPPLNLDAVEVAEYPAVFYHDVRFEYNVNEKYQFYMGVDNLFDKRAPFGLTATGGTGTTDRAGGGLGNAAIYDAFGRKLYAGFRARF